MFSDSSLGDSLLQYMKSLSRTSVVNVRLFVFVFEWKNVEKNQRSIPLYVNYPSAIVFGTIFPYTLIERRLVIPFKCRQLRNEQLEFIFVNMI